MVEPYSRRHYGGAGIPQCDPTRRSAARRTSPCHRRCSTDCARASKGGGGQVLTAGCSVKLCLGGAEGDRREVSLSLKCPVIESQVSPVSTVRRQSTPAILTVLTG